MDTINSIFFPTIYHNEPITHTPVNPFITTTTTTTTTTAVSTSSPTATTVSPNRNPAPPPRTTIAQSDAAQKVALQALQQQASARAASAATKGLRRSARVNLPSAPYLESVACNLSSITCTLPPVPSLAKYWESGDFACSTLPGAHGGSFIHSVVALDKVLEYAEPVTSPTATLIPVYDSSQSVLFSLDAACPLTSSPTPCVSAEPTTIQQALSGKYATYWHEAMQAELTSLVSNGV